MITVGSGVLKRPMKTRNITVVDLDQSNLDLNSVLTTANTIWSAMDIRIMLEAYYLAAGVGSRNHGVEAISESIARLAKQDLLEPMPDAQRKAVGTPTADVAYVASEKGKAFVHMILNTPLPEKRWVDPR